MIIVSNIFDYLHHIKKFTYLKKNLLTSVILNRKYKSKNYMKNVKTSKCFNCWRQRITH